jgi:putative nucleotidyltransferase with HDIG domain
VTLGEVMIGLSIIRDTSKRDAAFHAKLSETFSIEFKDLSELASCKAGQYSLVDFEFVHVSGIPVLKEWIRNKPKGAKVIFVTNKASHLQATRALAIGATGIVHHPVEPQVLLDKLLNGNAPSADKSSGELSSLSSDPGNAAIRKSPAVMAAVGTLQGIFASACTGDQIESSAINTASRAVVGQVEATGLNAWIDVVRTHHSLTYQHCLLVTGLAVAFGQQIGVSHADRQRLSFAGMLHDIGKARIPLSILEKPGKLDAEELAAMRKHPEYGFDALKSTAGLPPEMLDMVVHHHEYLDGSGYPHGIGSNEIADLVRMMTIVDVYGALIERRSYKPPMPADAAYGILVDMGAKLDQALVRAFKPVARLGL